MVPLFSKQTVLVCSLSLCGAVGDAPVPEAVKSFASKLCDGLRDNSTNDLHTMYEDDYNHISER